MASRKGKSVKIALFSEKIYPNELIKKKKNQPMLGFIGL